MAWAVVRPALAAAQGLQLRRLARPAAGLGAGLAVPITGSDRCEGSGLGGRQGLAWAVVRAWTLPVLNVSDRRRPSTAMEAVLSARRLGCLQGSDLVGGQRPPPGGWSGRWPGLVSPGCLGAQAATAWVVRACTATDSAARSGSPAPRPARPAPPPGPWSGPRGRGQRVEVIGAQGGELRRGEPLTWAVAPPSGSRQRVELGGGHRHQSGRGDGPQILGPARPPGASARPGGPAGMSCQLLADVVGAGGQSRPAAAMPLPSARGS
jgi:hypothetical protein